MVWLEAKTTPEDIRSDGSGSWRSTDLRLCYRSVTLFMRFLRNPLKCLILLLLVRDGQPTHSNKPVDNGSPICYIGLVDEMNQHNLRSCEGCHPGKILINYLKTSMPTFGRRKHNGYPSPQRFWPTKRRNRSH